MPTFFLCVNLSELANGVRYSAPHHLGLCDIESQLLGDTIASVNDNTLKTSQGMHIHGLSGEKWAGVRIRERRP
jgi:hypothetical protein